MTIEAKPATTGEWDRTHEPVVVAVDGSRRNLSAVTWAAHEAAAHGCGLVLVTALHDHVAMLRSRGEPVSERSTSSGTVTAADA